MAARYAVRPALLCPARRYVDARYSPHYEITGEELAWLVERIGVLREIVAAICAEKLDAHRTRASDV